MILFFILFATAYIAGSINFAIILFKVLRKSDPRNSYSGNAGTTNVFRQAGLFWAIVVLLLDIGRAMGIAFLSHYLLKIEYIPWIGFSLILGNRYPCFHNFKGGKGVANFLGFTAAINPFYAALSSLTWVAVYLIFRVPFIASFFMILVLCIGIIISCGYTITAFIGTIITLLFIYYNHKNNIIEYMKK